MTTTSVALWISLVGIGAGIVTQIYKAFADKLPKNLTPLVSIAVGLIAGFATALQQGLGWQQALVQALLGAFAGGLPIAVHESAGRIGQSVSAPAAVAAGKAVLFVAAFVAFGSVTACKWLTPSHVEDVAKITECILAHASEPPEQIAVTCAVENVQTVVDIISAHRAAAAREHEGVCATDGGQ